MQGIVLRLVPVGDEGTPTDITRLDAAEDLTFVRRFEIPPTQAPGRYRIEAEGAGLVETADLRITSSG
jgi:hypothetical protein